MNENFCTHFFKPTISKPHITVFFLLTNSTEVSTNNKDHSPRISCFYQLINVYN